MKSWFGTLGLVARIACAGIVVSLGLAACGGGGGGASAPPATPAPSIAPTIAPTVPPQSTPPPGTLALTQLTIDSAPQGLPVTINATPIGTTPQINSPQYAANTYHITIAAPNPYTFNYAQVGAGTKTLFYNQVADTTVSLGTVSSSNMARSVQSLMRRESSQASNPVRRLPLAVRGNLMKTDRLAVRYRVSALHSEGRSARDIESYEGVSGTDLGPLNDGTQTRIVMLPQNSNIDELEARLRAHTEVAAVDRVALRVLKSSTPVLPNDTHFARDQQWDMFQIGAPNAWGYSIGTPSIPVAIIDTGFDMSHQDLQNKVIYAESDVNSATSGVKVGLAAADDTDGHGTNVSGIAGADTNNGFGFAGTGYNISLMEFKIFPDTANAGASTDDEAKAIYDAVAQGARVINLSIGSTQDQGADPTEYAAIEYAIAHNVVVVAAAGNESLNTMDFPGAYPGVIAVGATSLKDNNTGNPATATEYVAGYSNYGTGLSIVAPGGDPNGNSDNDYLHWIYNIYTTTPLDPKQACKVITDCKAFFAGTSQATPHVAGAAGLLIAKNPALSAAQVTQILESTADNINDPKQGPGRLDLYRAMAAVAGDAAPVLPQLNNFVAIAYGGGTGNHPNILDVTYPKGIQPDASGNFRVADVRPGQTYRIALWYDANGDGIVDAGDWFGAGPLCSSSSTCFGGPINVGPVPAGFALP